VPAFVPSKHHSEVWRLDRLDVLGTKDVLVFIERLSHQVRLVLLERLDCEEWLARLLYLDKPFFPFYPLHPSSPVSPFPTAIPFSTADTVSPA